MVWVGAAGGVALKMLWPHSPRWLGVPFYLALGWVAVFVLPDLLHSGGVAVVVLIIAGGLLYSVGAIFYAIRRPNTWPGTFGYHEYLPRLCLTRRAVPLRGDLVAAVPRQLTRLCPLGGLNRPIPGRHYLLQRPFRCARASADSASAEVRGPRSRSRLTSSMAVAEVAQPVVRVVADQADRPDQGVRPGPGYAGIDQRVQDLPLRLTQPRHHRDGSVVNSSSVPPKLGAPGDFPAVPELALAGDLDARFPGVLAEPGDPARFGGRGGRRSSANVSSARGSSPTINDLVTIDRDGRAPDEPIAGQPAGEPAGGVGCIRCFRSTATTTATRAESPAGAETTEPRAAALAATPCLRDHRVRAGLLLLGRAFALAPCCEVSLIGKLPFCVSYVALITTLHALTTASALFRGPLQCDPVTVRASSAGTASTSDEPWRERPASLSSGHAGPASRVQTGPDEQGLAGAGSSR